MSCPENLVGYSFMIKKKVGRGKRPLYSSFLTRHHASIISSSSRLGWTVFLSLHGQARTVMALWKNYFRSQYSEGLSLWHVTFPQIIVFSVCREHILGVINLLSSLGRMWVSCHHCFIVWGHVSCFCCMGFVAKQACLVLFLCFFILFLFGCARSKLWHAGSFSCSMRDL